MLKDKYLIEQCIGKGNFGDVYRATNTVDNSLVAVKVINLDESDEDIAVLIQEIQFLSKLRSNYITKYFETFINDMSMWIVMEYCGGGSCADLLKCHRKLNEDTTAFIIRDVLKGLCYLHEENKVHRDIKLANILLTNQGEIKLADFGVSGEITMTQLKRNTFVGTPFWMAPEVIVRQKTGYNEKADIWSTGITTIELVTGSPPLSQYDPMKILFEIPKKRPPQLTGVDFSENIKDFVKYCLIKDPRRRPSSATLLHHRFVKNIKRNVNLLRLIEEKDRWFAKHHKNGKKPKYPLKDTLSNIVEKDPTIRWNFSTRNNLSTKYFAMEQTLMEKKLPIMSMSPDIEVSDPDFNLSVSPLKSPRTQYKSPDSPLSPVSPISQLAGAEPVTSPTPLSPLVEKLQTPVHDSVQAPTSPIDNSAVKQLSPAQPDTTSINYLEDVLLYCLQGLYHRARAPSTKTTVKKLMQNFVDYELEQPGLAQAFIEEVLILKEIRASSMQH